jgi:hypothetical protein
MVYRLIRQLLRLPNFQCFWLGIWQGFDTTFRSVAGGNTTGEA